MTWKIDREDWHKFKAETLEAAKLAQRHNLAIVTIPGTQGCKVQATRSGFCVETDGWSTMIELLQGMEREGDL